MWYFVTHGDFGAVSTDDNKEGGYCIVNFTSDTYTTQWGVIIDQGNFTMGEQVSNSCYLLFMIQEYKWYSEPLYG